MELGEAWGLGLRPAHACVVREATTRRQVLHRISKGEARPLDPLQPAIWADTTDDQRSGLEALEERWQSRVAAAGTGTGVLGKRPRGEPDPSSYAAWMRPSRQRPGPWRDRQVPALEPAVEPAQSQGPPSDTVEAAAPATGLAAPWAHVWRVIHTSHLDRRQRMTAWRLLHGKLFVGAFIQHIRRAGPAGHSFPHSGCESQPATLTHVFITCPLAARVWDWHAATWAAVKGETAPPRSIDLLLADDTRVWEPPRKLRPLWQRLRSAIICQLWAAYLRGRHQPPTHRPGSSQPASCVPAGRLSWPTGDSPPPTSGC